MIDGWIINFFPYIESQYEGQPKYRINPCIVGGDPNQQFRSTMLPGGLSRVPFKWQHTEGVDDIQFVSGFIGVWQDKASKALRPEIGWAIQDMEIVAQFRKTTESWFMHL